MSNGKELWLRRRNQELEAELRAMKQALEAEIEAHGVTITREAQLSLKLKAAEAIIKDIREKL